MRGCNKLLHILVNLLFATSLFAGDIGMTLKEDNLKQTIASYRIYAGETTLVSQDTIDSETMTCINYGYNSLWARGTSATDSVNLSILYQVSPYDSTRYWSMTKTHAICTLTDTLGDFYSVFPPPSKYIRFRVIGNVGNGADVSVYLKYFIWGS